MSQPLLPELSLPQDIAYPQISLKHHVLLDKHPHWGKFIQTNNQILIKNDSNSLKFFNFRLKHLHSIKFPSSIYDVILLENLWISLCKTRPVQFFPYFEMPPKEPLKPSFAIPILNSSNFIQGPLSASVQGTTILFGSKNSSLRAHDLETGKLLVKYTTNSRVSIRFQHKRRKLGQNTLPLSEIQHKQCNSLNCVSWNPFSKLFVVGSFDGSVCLYIYQDGEIHVLSTLLSANKSPVMQIKWSKCGKYIFVLSKRTNYIAQYDVSLIQPNTPCIKYYFSPPFSTLENHFFDLDATHLYIGTENGRLYSFPIGFIGGINETLFTQSESRNTETSKNCLFQILPKPTHSSSMVLSSVTKSKKMFLITSGSRPKQNQIVHQSYVGIYNNK